MRRLDRALELAELLTTAGLFATVDVGELAANLPGVLVPPPRVDLAAGGYGGGLVTWRLVLIAGAQAGAVDAWRQLDAALDQLADALPCELADPTSYQLPTGGDPLPAYTVTFTETV